MILPLPGRYRMATAAIALILVTPLHAAAQDEPTFRLGPGPWTVETFAPASRVRVGRPGHRQEIYSYGHLVIV